jgi:large subunit ribosomal protein L15
MGNYESFKHPSNVAERKRKGRGIAAGQGKTAGRGTKGYGSRSGNTEKPRFEGGQQPLVRHLPKLGGFKRHSKVVYHAVNLGDLADLKAGTQVDLLLMDSRGLLPKRVRGLKVKLLGGGVEGGFKTKLNFKLDAYSNKVRAIVEGAGGTCEVVNER